MKKRHVVLFWTYLAALTVLYCLAQVLNALTLFQGPKLLDALHYLAYKAFMFTFGLLSRADQVVHRLLSPVRRAPI